MKHAEYYMQLPMDVGLDQLAAVMLFVGMLTITMDVLTYLLSSLRFFENDDNSSMKQRTCCLRCFDTVHELIQTICYFNSMLVVSNLLVWVILAIALKPERAIPAATACVALGAHVSNLTKKLLDMLATFEDIATKQEQLIIRQLEGNNLASQIRAVLPTAVADINDSKIALERLILCGQKLNKKLSSVDLCRSLHFLIKKECERKEFRKVMRREQQQAEAESEYKQAMKELGQDEVREVGAGEKIDTEVISSVKELVKNAKDGNCLAETLKNYCKKPGGWVGGHAGILLADIQLAKDVYSVWEEKDQNAYAFGWKLVKNSTLTRTDWYDSKYSDYDTENGETTGETKNHGETKNSDDTKLEGRLEKMLKQRHQKWDNKTKKERDTLRFEATKQYSIKISQIVKHAIQYSESSPDCSVQSAIEFLEHAAFLFVCLSRMFSMASTPKIVKRVADDARSSAEARAEQARLAAEHIVAEARRKAERSESIKSIYDLLNRGNCKKEPFVKVLGQICGLSGSGHDEQWRKISITLIYLSNENAGEKPGGNTSNDKSDISSKSSNTIGGTNTSTTNSSVDFSMDDLEMGTLRKRRSKEWDKALKSKHIEDHLFLNQILTIVRQLTNPHNMSPRFIKVISHYDKMQLVKSKQTDKPTTKIVDTLRLLRNMKAKALTDVRLATFQKAYKEIRDLYKEKRNVVEKRGNLRSREFRPKFLLSNVTRIMARHGLVLDPIDVLILSGHFSVKNFVTANNNQKRLKAKDIDEAMQETVTGKALTRCEKAIEKAISVQNKGAGVVENIDRNQEVVDSLLSKFGLSRFRLLMIVVNSTILLILLFVLIFMSQSVFAMPGLAAGMISSFLCTSTTYGVNSSVKENTAGKKKAASILKSFNDSQENEFQDNPDLLLQLRQSAAVTFERRVVTRTVVKIKGGFRGVGTTGKIKDNAPTQIPTTTPNNEQKEPGLVPETFEPPINEISRPTDSLGFLDALKREIQDLQRQKEEAISDTEQKVVKLNIARRERNKFHAELKQMKKNFIKSKEDHKEAEILWGKKKAGLIRAREEEVADWRLRLEAKQSELDALVKANEKEIVENNQHWEKILADVRVLHAKEKEDWERNLVGVNAKHVEELEEVRKRVGDMRTKFETQKELTEEKLKIIFDLESKLKVLTKERDDLRKQLTVLQIANDRLNRRSATPAAAGDSASEDHVEIKIPGKSIKIPGFEVHPSSLRVTKIKKNVSYLSTIMVSDKLIEYAGEAVWDELSFKEAMGNANKKQEHVAVFERSGFETNLQFPMDQVNTLEKLLEIFGIGVKTNATGTIIIDTVNEEKKQKLKQKKSTLLAKKIALVKQSKKLSKMEEKELDLVKELLQIETHDQLVEINDSLATRESLELEFGKNKNATCKLRFKKSKTVAAFNSFLSKQTSSRRFSYSSFLTTLKTRVKEKKEKLGTLRSKEFRETMSVYAKLLASFQTVDEKYCMEFGRECLQNGENGVGLLKTEQINRWHNEMTTAFECTKKWRAINMVTSRVSESYIFDVSKAVIGKSTLDADKVIANNVVRCNELLVGNVSPLLCINTTFPI